MHLQVSTDVTTEILISKLYLLGFLKGFLKGFCLVLSIRGHSNDATSGSDYLTVFQGCAAMEDDASLYLIDTCDRVTLLVFLRLTTRNQHDTYCCTLVKLNSALVEIALCNTFEEIDDV